MSEQYTPGPWRAINITGVWIVGRDDGHLLTKIPAGSIDAEANARLIAAAPDLLDALERLVHLAECNTSPGPNTLTQARAAIAKVGQR